MDYRVLLYFPFGFIGGLGAYLIGTPMPFLLGGILGAACFVIYYVRNGDKLPKLTRWVRLVFMSVIGTMIGSRFSPELLTLLPQFWISGLAIIPFILLAHGGSAYLPERVARPYLEQGRLFQIAGAPEFTRPVFLVCNKTALAVWPWFDAALAELQSGPGRIGL